MDIRTTSNGYPVDVHQITYGCGYGLDVDWMCGYPMDIQWMSGAAWENMVEGQIDNKKRICQNDYLIVLCLPYDCKIR